jgi:uncharacterized protein YeaO (DUF488 family)
LLNVGWNDFKNRLMKEYNSNQPKFSHIIEMLRRINTHSNVTLSRMMPILTVIDIWLKS